MEGCGYGLTKVS